MKRTAAVAALLLLAACSSEPPTRTAAPSRTATPPRTAGPSATTTTAAGTPEPGADPAALTVAVIRAGGALELYRLDPRTRAAVLERVLAPPQEDADVLRVATSRTQVCATWHLGTGEVYDDPRTSLVCYPAGSSRGQVVDGTRHPLDVALSADGTRIAWAEVNPGENQALSTARLDDGALSTPRRFLSRADQPEMGGRSFTGTVVQSLAWAGGAELAISTSVESDDGPALLRLDVASSRTRGWLDDGRPVGVRTDGYLTYESVVSVQGGTALAVERASYMDEQRPPSRAVRVDLATGRVLTVLATAAAGRDVLAVSGDREAVLYLTGRLDGTDNKTYLRLAGEARGTPVTGLPEDAQQVVTTGRSG